MKTGSRYIAELPEDLRRRMIEHYKTLIKKLDERILADFLLEILKLSERGYTAQYIGKFRSTIFEEYVVLLLRRICNKTLSVVRQAKIPLGDYEVTVDVAVMQRNKPSLIIECKVDLDASRLKTALGEYLILSNAYKNLRYLIVYFNSLISQELYRIASRFVPIVHVTELRKTVVKVLKDSLVNQ